MLLLTPSILFCYWEHVDPCVWLHAHGMQSAADMTEQYQFLCNTVQAIVLLSCHHVSMQLMHAQKRGEDMHRAHPHALASIAC